MFQELDLASVAALIGEPSRALILAALLSSEALPASELAYRAQVTPQTASSHLGKLLEGNLVKVTQMGRHHYYSLKNREVAQVLEALQLVAPISTSMPPRIAKISPELCHARTCYDHLAGKLGVSLTHALLEQRYLIQEEQNYILTTKGTEWFELRQVDLESLKKKRRKFAYACLDWSERHHHIAGTLGAAITQLFFDNHWVKHLPHTRALQITSAGEKMLKQDFDLTLGI